MKLLLPSIYFGFALCAFNLTSAVAQPSVLSQFFGTWSEKEIGCRYLKSGQLENMSTAKASRYGIIEISSTGIEWPYNSGTTECEFRRQSEAKIVGQTLQIQAVCNYKGNATNENIILANKASSKVELQFENNFWNGGHKIRMSKCDR